MSRIYRYILASDSGMAPCVQDGRITLATCKPVIRRGARPGDWVLGFRPAPAPAGLLVWAARVERSLPWEAYRPAHPERRDAVYRPLPSGGFARVRPDYHPDPREMARDLSAPVLGFDPAASWYFGADPRMLPDALHHLAPRGRGHRVSGGGEGDAGRLEAWLRGLPSGTAPPPDRPRGKKCSC